MTAEHRDRVVGVDDPSAPVVSGTTVSGDAVADDIHGETAGQRQDDVELVPATRRADFEARWREIQSAFVDDPRRAVEQADALVGEVAQALTASFSDRKAALEQHAGAGDEMETEELRQALRSYRALFERVLRI